VELPPRLAGTELRILATSDLGATVTPMRTSFGEAGTCAGVASLLEAELRPGELRRAIEAYWAEADPRNADGERLAWNWCRMPAGTSIRGEASVAVVPGVAGHLSEWLDRDVAAAPAG
jgi:hypothetical protein